MLAAEPDGECPQRKGTIGFVADRVQRQQGTLAMSFWLAEFRSNCMKRQRWGVCNV